MKTEQWLREATKTLEAAGIGTARLDCLVLLEDATAKDRAFLLANPKTELTADQLQKLNEQMEKRVKHIPLAQIRGKTEFFGREFIIDEHVLEPRPESETMIELLLGLGLQKGAEIIDIGTGSGALGITTKLELTDTKVTLIDLDEHCLEVAKRNAKNHEADVKILKGNLLAPVMPLKKGTFYTLICNLPYVPEKFEINQAAMNEPRLAIFGGEDGLKLYKQLFEQIIDSTVKPIYLCCESLPFQHKVLKAIAKQADYKQLKEADFIQIFEKV
jgi:release factor glutamine methyltransferase